MFLGTQIIPDSIRSFVLEHLMYYKAALANSKGGEVQLSWHCIIQPVVKMFLSLLQKKTLKKAYAKRRVSVLTIKHHMETSNEV